MLRDVVGLVDTEIEVKTLLLRDDLLLFVVSLLDVSSCLIVVGFMGRGCEVLMRTEGHVGPAKGLDHLLSFLARIFWDPSLLSVARRHVG